MSAKMKPYRSRSLIFNHKNNNNSDSNNSSSSNHPITTPTSPSNGSASGSPTSPTHLIGRAFFFSPLSTSGSQSPPAVNTPSPDLDTDPFRSSIDSIPYSRSHSFSSNRDGNSDAAHGHGVNARGDGTQSTTSLVRATATTPKITLASPSTTSFHFLDYPPLPKDRSGLDPTAAKRIAKSILKNKAKEAELVLERQRQRAHEHSSTRQQGPTYVSTSDPPDVAREARRTVSTSDLRGQRKSNHPLSMRTLRRQPSLVDLHTHRTKADLIQGNGGEDQPQPVQAASRKAPDLSKACHPKRQEHAWKNILGRRESEAWRQLVDSKDRNSVPSVIDDMISPKTRTFPAAGDDRSAPVPPRPERRPSHLFLSSYDHPQGGLSNPPVAPRHTDERNVDNSQIPVEHSRASSPEFADAIDFSSRYASPTYTYSHLDLSFSMSSGMSRCGTLGSRLDSLPMSVAMERQVPRSGLGSYDSGKLEARADALRRLSGVPSKSTQMGVEGEDDDRIRMLRRAASFKKEKEPKKEKVRPRAYSLSAKSVRESVISSPIAIPDPLPDRRRTIERSKGIEFGDLTIDLGGRYGHRSSTGVSSETSLYPASNASSRVPSRANIVGRPFQNELSGSEISLLAPSSVGLGFSPIGTPVSLPESLQAEAIDLTGNYGAAHGEGVGGKEVRRSVSRRRIKLDSPPPPLPAFPAELVDSAAPSPSLELESGSKPRRSLLLAQNTFYIPPIVAPPSLRSSKSLSNLRPSQPATPTVPTPAPQSKTTYTKRSHTRRGTGGFGICSPPDAIDPLPFNHSEVVSPVSLPGLERKKSSPFINASASIRMMLTKNPIARSLSKTFDRERERERDESTLRHDESTADQSCRSVEKEWREGLLKEAVTASLGAGSTSQRQERRSGNPRSRLAIPTRLLEAPIIDESAVPSDHDGAAELDSEDELYAKLALSSPNPSSTKRETERLPADDSMSVYSHHESTLEESRPRSSSTKRRSRSSTVLGARFGSVERSATHIIPPLPFQVDQGVVGDTQSVEREEMPCGTPLTTLDRRSVPCYSEPPAALSGTLQRRPTPYYNRGVARHLEVDIDAPPADTASLAPSTRSLRSLALRLRHRPSRTTLAQPISSSSSPPPQPRAVLDALSSRERDRDRDHRDHYHDRDRAKEGDKNRKILEWRTEVDENGELARLEERMVKHVERERETLRDMGRREGSSPREV